MTLLTNFASIFSPVFEREKSEGVFSHLNGLDVSCASAARPFGNP
jgi:hypothetical protein